MNQRIGVLAFLACLFLFLACGGGDTYPRPRGFFRINIAEPASYHQFEETSCPVTFKYPETAKIDYPKGKDSCLFNIVFPELNATMYMTYKNVDNNLKILVDDAHLMKNKHLQQSSGMEDRMIDVPDHKVGGYFFDIYGTRVATPLQFFVTDTTSHFLHGSLYFYSVPNNDSLKPVIKYLRHEFDQLVKTVEWKQ